MLTYEESIDRVLSETRLEDTDTAMPRIVQHIDTDESTALSYTSFIISESRSMADPFVAIPLNHFDRDDLKVFDNLQQKGLITDASIKTDLNAYLNTIVSKLGIQFKDLFGAPIISKSHHFRSTLDAYYKGKNLIGKLGDDTVYTLSELILNEYLKNFENEMEIKEQASKLSEKLSEQYQQSKTIGGKFQQLIGFTQNPVTTQSKNDVKKIIEELKPIIGTLKSFLTSRKMEEASSSRNEIVRLFKVANEHQNEFGKKLEEILRKKSDEQVKKSF